MTMRRVLASIPLLLAIGPVLAESTPAAGRYDGRMKQIAYNRNDVFKVVGHYGYSTDIEFGTDESVQNIAIGDSLAWEVAPASNHLFVKPREDNAVTNMTVITNKRVYQFALDARRGGTPRDHAMYFQVRFTFPDEEAARKRGEQEDLVARSHALRMQSALNTANLPANWNYYACGTRILRPTEVYDDGRFTFLRFPGAQEIPAIFTINADGSESIVNGAMKGDQYVIQVTAPRFVLRRGNAVACVENRSFNPYGIATPSGTVSPDVQRALVAPLNPVSHPVVPPGDASNTTTGPGALGQPVDNGSSHGLRMYDLRQGTNR
jgi:type IV secretion system protein VirB9